MIRFFLFPYHKMYYDYMAHDSIMICNFLLIFNKVLIYI